MTEHDLHLALEAQRQALPQSGQVGPRANRMCMECRKVRCEPNRILCDDCREALR